ncbi:MAG: 50S ribosomal protein L19, partial [Parachlamydiales bacterium]
MNQLIQEFEKSFLRKRQEFKIGDTLKVSLKVSVEEDLSEEDKEKKKKASKRETAKERIQVFTGTVIARKGSGLSETFTLYRNAYGSSMERIFL